MALYLRVLYPLMRMLILAASPPISASIAVMAMETKVMRETVKPPRLLKSLEARPTLHLAGSLLVTSTETKWKVVEATTAFSSQHVPSSLRLVMGCADPHH
jgi:hypothetical protein